MNNTFTVEITPKYGDIVMHGSERVVVTSFQGVLADALYGTRTAWAHVQRKDGKCYMCSLYDLSPVENGLT